MNRDLENIKVSIEKSDKLNKSEKEAILNSIKAVEKELTILEFKLQRTEKVKRTTSVLLEETIDELEKKYGTNKEAVDFKYSSRTKPAVVMKPKSIPDYIE